MTILPVLWLVVACDDEDAATPRVDAAPLADAGAGPDAPAADASSGDATVGAIELKFEGRVGGEKFRCGGTYVGVGTSGATVTAGDLRFFIHDVRLLAGTREIPLELNDASPWQSSRLALLDFEDKTGGCSFGTTGTNDIVRGKAAGGPFTGIAFTVGVPDDLNHVNVDLAPAPLGPSKLQWDWTNGFIHFASELDSVKTIAVAQDAGASDGGAAAGGAPDAGGFTKVPPFYAHIGSTLCAGDPGDGGVATCGHANRAVVRLDNFDPARDKIVVDLAKLLSDSNVDENTPNSIPGCMSGPSDPECPRVFSALGIDFATGQANAATQRVFSREPR
jgi:uncharacterized repeat protein (TIGR04052 family)